MENENIVKKTCKELGITQKKLAEKMGVSEKSVSGWINDKQPISKWAIRSFELLQKEKSFDEIIQILQKFSK